MWYVQWMKEVEKCLADRQTPVVVYQKGFCENGEIKADPTGKLGKGLGHSQRGEVRFLVGEKKQSIIRIAAESMPDVIRMHSGLNDMQAVAAAEMEKALQPAEEDVISSLNYLIRAPAGAGKTFMALHMMLKVLSMKDARVLFIVKNEALAQFIAVWVSQRLSDQGDLHPDQGDPDPAARVSQLERRR